MKSDHDPIRSCGVRPHGRAKWLVLVVGLAALSVATLALVAWPGAKKQASKHRATAATKRTQIARPEQRAGRRQVRGAIAPPPRLQTQPVDEVVTEEPADDRTPDIEPPTPEEEKRIVLDRWANDLRDHEREPLDRGWAQTTGQSLSQDVQGLAQQGNFQVLGTDCRTTTCTAKVHWSSYSEATKNYEVLLHADYQANCARGIVLPPLRTSRSRTTERSRCLLGQHRWLLRRHHPKGWLHYRPPGPQRLERG